MSKINLDKLPKNITANTVPTNPDTTKKSSGQWWKILTAVLMLAYIIVPTDLLPDLMPIIGWVDDLGAAVGMIASIVSAIKSGRYNPDSRMEQRAKDIFGNDNF